MLGQLLQFAVHARPSAQALEFYAQLGFRQLPVHDVSGGPYAALSDGTVTLGLQAEELDAPMPVFVRPDLKANLRALRRLGVDLDLAELKDDEFNRAAFRDPNGLAVMLVEARMFSPAARDRTEISACGTFLEWSVETHALAESEVFWTALGLTRVAAASEPHPWVRLAGHGLVVGFHEAAVAAGLSFIAPDLDARVEYLQAKKLPVRRGAPLAPPGTGAATLLAPEQTPFYLVDAPHPI